MLELLIQLMTIGLVIINVKYIKQLFNFKKYVHDTACRVGDSIRFVDHVILAFMILSTIIFITISIDMAIDEIKIIPNLVSVFLLEFNYMLYLIYIVKFMHISKHNIENLNQSDNK